MTQMIIGGAGGGMSMAEAMPRVLRVDGRRSVAATLTGVRWGRLLVLVACVALVVAAGAVAVARAGAQPVRVGDGATVVRAPALTAHTVAPGETLWSLADTAAPQADPRETVDRIMRLNGLTGPQVQIGQVVLLPSAG